MAANTSDDIDPNEGTLRVCLDHANFDIDVESPDGSRNPEDDMPTFEPYELPWRPAQQALVPIAEAAAPLTSWLGERFPMNVFEQIRKAIITLLRAERVEFEKQVPSAMVMSELKKPRETFVLARGDYRNHTEKVEPGVPAMLPPLAKDAPLNRLTLAKWLVDPSHPLTARVTVNRFWQMYFGTGIVKTQEDFGIGWTLDVGRGFYRNNRAPGQGWQVLSQPSPLGPIPCQIVDERQSHLTEVRLSDREFYTFALVLSNPAPLGGGCLTERHIAPDDRQLGDGQREAPCHGTTLVDVGFRVERREEVARALDRL